VLQLFVTPFKREGEHENKAGFADNRTQ